MKEFRNYMLDRFPQLKEVQRSTIDLHILVAMKGHHSSGIDYSQESVCNFVKNGVNEIAAIDNNILYSSIVVECIKPQYVDFLTEHTMAREAHIIISMDGSVSFISAFSHV